MEENNQNEQTVQIQENPVSECPCQENATPQSPVAEEVVNIQLEQTQPAQKGEEPKQYKPRKNHRNKNARANQNKAGATSTCGEIAEGQVAKEKLSGEHQAGYKSGEGYKPKNKPSFDSNANDDEQKECNCEKSDEHKGPAFEKSDFKPRAVEVSLDDAKAKSKKGSKNDVVSYSCTEEPNISILSRIKRLFDKLFKKDKKSKAKFDKKNRKGDFKNRKGDRRFNNSKGDFKKGDFKNRKYHHNKRHDRNGFNKKNRAQNNQTKES